MGKNPPKFVEVTKDKAYMIFAVYANCIRDVQTDKVSVSEKLLDVFMEYIQVGTRYARSMEQLRKSLKDFEKDHGKETQEYKDKVKEIEKEIEELGKQTVQIAPFITKQEFMEIVKKEPAYKFSSGHLYNLFYYKTGENDLEDK